MHSRTLTLIFAGLVFLLCLLSGCGQQGSQQEFEYEWEDGVLFQSNFKEPKVLLREFALKQEIIVETELLLEKPNENPEIFNKSIIPFYTVVAGNDRNAVQLLLFVGSGGRIQECQTNFGNVKTQVALQGEECSELLDKWNYELLIFFPLPDASIKRSSVILEENKIIIKAKNTEEQAVLSRSLAEHLFPNAREILDRAKEKLKKLK